MKVDGLSKFVNGIRGYTVLSGQLWGLCTMVFRLFIVGAIGSSVYGGDFKDFVCDTSQPGCNNVCFNRFSPMNHIRFWSFQLLFVCCPVIFFHFFAQYQTALVHKAKLLTAKFNETEDRMKVADDDKQFSELRLQSILLKTKRDSVKTKIGNYGSDGYKEKTKRTLEKDTKVVMTQRIKLAYILQVICRLFLEVLFFLLTAYLQSYKNMSGFGMGDFKAVFEPTRTFYEPERYNCTHAVMGNYMGRGYSACAQNTQIVCWNSRPWEKQIFMYYMTVMNFLCIIFTAFELIEVIYLESSRSSRRNLNKNIRMEVSPEYATAPITEEQSVLQLNADEPQPVTEKEPEDKPSPPAK